MKVFVTGGNGFLGSRTVEALVGRGHSVRCLLRPESDLSRIRHLPFESHRGDVRDATSVAAGAEGCDAIIHLAGISSWEQIRKEAHQLEAIVVGGTRNVLEAALRAGVKRTVMVSSSAAINGSRRPKVFTEKSAYRLKNPSLGYSLAKRKAERVVRGYVKNQDLDAVIVNPCEVYGAQDIGLVTASNLIGLLTRSPAVVCTGGTAVAHVDDVARGIVLALENGRKGERYILGGDNLTLEQMARVVRRLAGKSDQVITLPNGPAVALCKGLARLGMTPPVSLDVLEYATLYWFVDSSKAERELGYQSRPAEQVFADVVAWLIDTRQVPSSLSLRYGGGALDARTAMIRLFGMLQRKKIVILDSDPKLCGEVLAASDTKGTFLEKIFATPAWHPIYSIESMDGPRWEQLSRDFKKLMAQLDWRERLTPLTRQHIRKDLLMDSEAIARWVVRVLYELLFDHPLSITDEELYYQASLEWRKEIAIKGKADEAVKAEFWRRLGADVAQSRFKEGLESYAADPSSWLSLFAQPFLISPQINIGDIFVTVFHYLRMDPGAMALARQWAAKGDKTRLGGVVLEAIRLRHPFPILERELKKELKAGGRKYAVGTQFFILLDQFKQDQRFDPERWLSAPSENPFYAIPFAAGPRMCIGKPIAMELLVEMLRSLLTDFEVGQVQPQLGHLYSGRANDGQASASESRYQARRFSSGLWESLRMGRKVRAGGCPFVGAWG